MNIILDSNVIVAAFGGRGLCNSLFELCVSRFTIIVSKQILSEVHTALCTKLKIPEESSDEIIDYLKEFCILSEYNKLTENVSRDRDDDEILALGISNNVKYLISGDKDLLVLKKYKTIKIVTPREFWNVVREDKL